MHSGERFRERQHNGRQGQGLQSLVENVMRMTSPCFGSMVVL